MIKRLLLILLVLILGVAGYYWYMFSRKNGGHDGPKQAPLTIRMHSDKFNRQIDSLLAAYFAMKAAFVEADSTRAKAACRKMLQMTDSMDLAELKKDTTGIFASDSLSLENIKANAKASCCKQILPKCAGISVW